jgi:hypothetical protein
MSQIVGNELTRELIERLDGRRVESHEGKIIPIFTIDQLGWAHPAVLSYYEIVAKNSSTLEMALWKSSSTANNLRLNGKVTCMISDKGVNYYLKGTAQETEAEMTGAPAVSRFRVRVEQIVEDQEPNAEITSGLTYRRLTERSQNDFATKVFSILRDEQ